MNSKAFDLEKLAADIYNEVYGDIDSKQVHAEKQTEILDWLTDGNLDDDATLESLVADWREYDNSGPALPAGWGDGTDE